jgi:hypothetical protein
MVKDHKRECKEGFEVYGSVVDPSQMMTGDKILLLGAQDGGAYQVTDNFC